MVLDLSETNSHGGISANENIHMDVMPPDLFQNEETSTNDLPNSNDDIFRMSKTELVNFLSIPLKGNLLNNANG